MPELKELIKTRRLEIGKTLEQVGKEMGVAKATVQRWESGEIKDMRQGKLVALAKALDVSPAYLMGWESENKKPDLETEDGLNAAKRALIDKVRVMDDSTVQALNQIADSIIDKREK